MRRYLILTSAPEGSSASRSAEAIEMGIRRHVVCGAYPDKVQIEKCILPEDASLQPSDAQLREMVGRSDFVVAAENCLDAFSFGLKYIGRVAAICREMEKPLDVVCASCALPQKVLKKSGITNVFEGGPCNLVAGCDEAGRGCLAGPVFAAAVILPEGFCHPLLNDSKQLSMEQRTMLRAIVEREALAWKVTAVSAAEIDEINILNASIAGMQRSLDGLGRTPDLILVDGNKFKPYKSPSGIEIPHQCIVHGDARCAAIAAASILAKTHRDEYMTRLAKEFPQYGWDRNMAYPTAEHKAAIRQYGITPHHRKTYKMD